jgi:RNA polymerase sigma factor (sigma-70 family)
MDLEKIINLCKNSDRISQKTLYNKYIMVLYKLSLRYVANIEDAEDCTSEAFVRVFEKIKTFEFKEINSFEVWMKQIVINQSLMCLRKRKTMLFYDLNLFENEHFEDLNYEKIDADLILEKVMSLPDGYRTVFNLYIMEGFTHTEIAEKLGISPNTSKTQLHKAKLSLQKALGPEFKTIV